VPLVDRQDSLVNTSGEDQGAKEGWGTDEQALDPELGAPMADR